MQAIAIACCFKDKGSILIVCPAVLRYTWAEELERWDPSFMPKDIHLGMEYICFRLCENWYLSHFFTNSTNLVSPHDCEVPILSDYTFCIVML